MHRTTGMEARPRECHWAGLGLLLTLAVLAHDLGMANLAAHGALQVVPGAIAAAAVHVAHASEQVDAGHDGGSDHHRAGPAAPEGGHPCDLTRTAARARNDSLDAALQTIPGAITAFLAWDETLRVPDSIDVPVRSPRERRALLQVFLI